MVCAAEQKNGRTNFCLGYTKRPLDLISLRVESRTTLLNIPAMVILLCSFSVDVLESLL